MAWQYYTDIGAAITPIEVKQGDGIFIGNFIKETITSVVPCINRTNNIHIPINRRP
jgi:hypothetical protein